LVRKVLEGTVSEEHHLQEDRGSWVDPKGRLVIPPDNTLKKRIMHAYHNGLSGHPGRDEIVWKIMEQFF
jgi:hypothetical protein